MCLIDYDHMVEKLSAIPFCQGLRKLVRLGFIALETGKSVTSLPNLASLSKIA
jgi:hypothetical protein